MKSFNGTWNYDFNLMPSIDEKIIIINHLISSMGAIEVPAKYEKEFKSKFVSQYD